MHMEMRVRCFGAGSSVILYVDPRYQLSHEKHRKTMKNPPTVQKNDFLIGIVRMVSYNPHTTGLYDPLCTPNNFFFIAKLRLA